jgi:hypothetical protein
MSCCDDKHISHDQTLRRCNLLSYRGCVFLGVFLRGLSYRGVSLHKLLRWTIDSQPPGKSSHVTLLLILMQDQGTERFLRDMGLISCSSFSWLPVCHKGQSCPFQALSPFVCENAEHCTCMMSEMGHHTDVHVMSSTSTLQIMENRNVHILKGHFFTHCGSCKCTGAHLSCKAVEIAAFMRWVCSHVV